MSCQTTDQEEDRLSKNYQTDRGRAGTGRVTAKKTKPARPAAPASTEVDTGLPGWALPESVQIAMVDLADTAREGMLAFAVSGKVPRHRGSTQAGGGIMSRRFNAFVPVIATEMPEIRIPRNWAAHGVNGPIRQNANVTVQPLNDGARAPP